MHKVIEESGEDLKTLSLLVGLLARHHRGSNDAVLGRKRNWLPCLN
jgi:hypothetical protein